MVRCAPRSIFKIASLDNEQIDINLASLVLFSINISSWNFLCSQGQDFW
jgi:hypothetical protein